MSSKSYSSVAQTSGSSASKPQDSGFSWADDVEDTFYQDAKTSSISTERALSVAYATGAHYTYHEGVKYKHPPRAPAIFALEEPDRRYEYENQPSSSEISPTSGTSNELERNDASMESPVVYVQRGISTKSQKKKNKRRKGDPPKGPQTSPTNLSSDTYAEMIAAQDDFHRNLPNSSQLLIPVNPTPTPIVENLWADYDEEPEVPIYMG